MSGWIRGSRLVAMLIILLLCWNDLSADNSDGNPQAEAAPEFTRVASVTTRGGLRPAAPGPAGLDVLIAQPRIYVPSPTVPPTATPEPTPAAEPEFTDLGIFRVTGYSDSIANGTDGNGITRSGQRTRWGVVAVDPRVIPLGSRLLIEGMEDTVFTALDTGGGIVGRWVDVWYSTDWDARAHGVRQLRVQLVP
jgi:3D (Asp-Asp-Asp) domain-containing protein